MADLTARERRQLPDSAFAYIDSTGRRRLPIHDEAHVRNALARFNRVVFEDEAARDRARTRLLRAAKRYGIVPVGFIEGQLRPKLPTGTLTLLFSDVEDSSQHLAELGDGYGAMLSAVRRVHRTAVRTAGGYEVDARADEFFAVFESAASALSAAIAIQRALAEHPWRDGRVVRVRIGLHTGRPTLTAAGYQGISVHTAARVAALAIGGQVLLTGSTRAGLGDEGGGVELRSLGRRPLRGIPEPPELFDVVIPPRPPGDRPRARSRRPRTPRSRAEHAAAAVSSRPVDPDGGAGPG